jgi:hypothetical protein
MINETTQIQEPVNPACSMTAGYQLPLFVCRKCLKQKEKSLFVKNSKLKNGIDSICKECKNSKKYHNNPKQKESSKKALGKYRKTDKYKKYHIEYHKTEKYKTKSRIRNRKYQQELHKKNSEYSTKKAKKQCDLLNDGYVINRLSRKTKLKAKELRQYPELISIQRMIIKTKRLCKTLENSEKN